MLGNIGLTEIIIVLVVALLIFGPKKLPEMGKAIGSAVTEFKKGLSGQPSSDTHKSEPQKLSEPDSEESAKETPSGPAG